MVKLIKNRKNYKSHATSGNRNRTYKAEGEEICPFPLHGLGIKVRIEAVYGLLKKPFAPLSRIFRKIFLSEKKACNQ